MDGKIAHKKVSVIILNYNGWEDTIECLESVYQMHYPQYNVIIADNNSIDDSIEKIKNYCQGKIKIKSKLIQYTPKNKPIIVKQLNEKELSGLIEQKSNFITRKNLIIIKNQKNYGFAKGNNIAIEYALNTLKSDYVLLLNNDTVVDKKFLNNLIEVGKIDKKIGILGSTVYFYDEPNKIQSAGIKLNWKKGTVKTLGINDIDKKQFSDIKEVDYVDGSNMLIKEEVFKKIGYLNSKYFLYWEETDFCVRAHKADYKIVYVPNVKIWHKVGSTTKKVSGYYEYYMTRNMFWFMKKHANDLDFSIFILYFFSYKIWFRIGIMIYNKNLKVLKPFLKGIIEGIFQ